MTYLILRPLILVLCKALYRLSVRGREHIPRSGPVILVANHVSYLDPVVLGAACPRVVSFMAKAELFRVPVFGRFLRAMQSFPVRRDVADRTAFKTAFKLLDEGRALGIFPQGTRQRQGIGSALPGTAVIARKSGAPVVPAAIIGTDRVMTGRRLPRFPKITVHFGPPMRLKGAGIGKEQALSATEEILSTIRELYDSENAQSTARGDKHKD